MNKRFSIVLLMIISAACKAQTSDTTDISADRPGVATPPSIMPSKIFQIETGFSFEKIRNLNSTRENILYNSSLLRFGISNNAEVRLQTDYAGLKTDSMNKNGFNPLTIGTKLLITEGKGAIPKTSFIFNLTLPYFGKKDFRPTNLAPSIYLLMQNDISERLNVCYNLGLEYDGESQEPAEFAAICLGYNFTDKLSGFVENYNWFSSATPPQYYFDLGFAYLTGKNFQFDVSGNMDMRDLKNYLMFNFGASWRMNNVSRK